MSELVIHCDLAEGYLGRDVVVMNGLVPGRVACRSIFPQMCFDG